MIEVEKYNPVTEKIIGCAIEVHKALKNGFQELIYQRALAYEFVLQEIPFAREQEIKVYYKEREVGTRRVDFLVAEEIVVELKAISELNNIHLAQTLNYLEAYNLPLALILNFGEPLLKVKRVVNSKYKLLIK